MNSNGQERPGSAAEIARMRFESAKNPAEKGELVLTSDGTLTVQPSEELKDQLARLEEEAVDRSRKVSIVAGGAFIAVGAIIALAGWAAGRIAGRLRETIEAPRPVDKVKMFADPEGGVHLLIPGTGPQKIALDWAPGETDANEAVRFLLAYSKLKGVGSAEAG
ncbi:MAG TPA: hypothetical protein VFW40_04425 [Capsulimonadaceae bacterium]|nr:hypothetical protein [Capsulimonadaceae bacterium]